MICPIHDVAYPDGGSCWCCDLKLKDGDEVTATTTQHAEVITERIDAPLPPRTEALSINQHCGKHDTIFTEDAPCRGCMMELESRSGQDSPSAGSSPVKTDSKILGPDDTLAELRTPPGKSSWPAWMAAPWAKKKE